jgi:hypothetical protein
MFRESFALRMLNSLSLLAPTRLWLVVYCSHLQLTHNPALFHPPQCSNHGGRQIDGAIPAIAALPAVVDAARKHNVPVFCDTGVSPLYIC